MAFESSLCTCMASALALFIRRVAHIDLGPVRHTSHIRSLHAAKRNLSTFGPLLSRGTPQHEAVNTATYVAADLEDSITFDRTRPKGKLDSSKPGSGPLQSSAVDHLNPRKWAEGNLEQKYTVSAIDLLPPNMTYNVGRTGFDSDTSGLSETTHQDKSGAAFLELTPETIDMLAAKSSGDNVHSKPNAAKQTWEARPNRPWASMKGFRLHYSSPPITPTREAGEARNRDSPTSEPQVPEFGTADHRRYPVFEREPWQTQKTALKEKFREGWNPRKKLSPDALAGIRAIHAQFPEQYTTSVLAEKFEVSPEAIRRILKSSWTPKEEEVLDRQRRWFLRGQKVWSRYAELGLKPPSRWRKLGIRKEGSLAAGRRERQSVGTNLTMRSADHAARESDENLSASRASMAERIL